MTEHSDQILLGELIQKELDGCLTDHEFMQLQGMLKNDPDTLKYYVKIILTAAEFSVPSVIPFIEQECLSQKPDILDNSVWQALAEDQMTSPEIKVTQDESRPEPIQAVTYEHVLWSFKKSTIATILINVAAMILVVLFVRYAPVRGKSYASVTGEYQSQVKGAESPIQVGQLLYNDVIKLERGLLQIQMNNGAEVLLEGPVEVSLEEVDQLFLIRGKLTASVPKEAVGFTVRTPSASIIDYGTEFGVMVDQYAGTETHVMKGNVKLGLGSDPRVLEKTIRLTANQAGSVSGQILKEIPCNAGQFVYEIPSPLEITAKSLDVSMYLHLQRDSIHSLSDVAGKVGTSSIEISPDLSITEGPYSGQNKESCAFRIQGAENKIKITDTQAIQQSRSGEFSIGFWVRFNEIREQIVFSGRVVGKQGTHMRYIGMDDEGKLQQFYGKKSLVVRSPDSLYAGRWHFVVISRGAREDNSKSLYIDGHKVATSTPDREGPIGQFEMLQFGGDSGNNDSFEGELAEIMFFPTALDDKAVQLLYKAATQ